MTVVVEEDLIRLEGRCRVEDAEALLAALQARPDRAIDLRDCTSLHTALVQLLLIAPPPRYEAPRDAALAAWLVPLLDAGGGPFEPLPLGL